MLKPKEHCTYWATQMQHESEAVGASRPIILIAEDGEYFAAPGDIVFGVKEDGKVTVYEIAQTGNWAGDPHADYVNGNNLLWLLPAIIKVIATVNNPAWAFLPENTYANHLLNVCCQTFVEQALDEMANQTSTSGAAVRLSDCLGELFIDAFLGTPANHGNISQPQDNELQSIEPHHSTQYH